MPGVRTIVDSGFSDDDGAADPVLAAALRDYDADPDTRHLATLQVLQEARLLVPVLAVLGEVEYDEQGLAHDKASDMATVLLTGRDGRSALLSFTGIESLQAWNPEARPVAVSARDAARSALHDGAEALLVDVAGPVLFAVEGADLQALADGARVVRVGDRHGWVAG